MECLIESAYSRCPLPTLARFRLQNQLLADGFGILLLHHGVKVLRSEILVQIHLVIQVLESGDAAQDEIVCLVLEVQAGIQQVTLVTAFVVIIDFVQVIGTVFRLSIGTAYISIRVSALVGIFIIERKVQFTVFGRQVDSPDTSAEFIVHIDSFAIELVLEESALVLIESSGRKGKLGRDAVIMRDGSLVVIVGSRSQTQVRTLVAEGGFGKDTDETSHGITSVECPLRPTHHVYPFDVRVVEIESRLIDKRNVIDVQPDCRGIDARTDTPHIHGSSQFGTIIRNEQVGYQSGKRFDRSDRVLSQVVLRKRGSRYGLLAQTVVLFRSSDDHYLFDVNDFGCIFRNHMFCISRRSSCDGCGNGYQRSQYCTSFHHFFFQECV